MSRFAPSVAEEEKGCVCCEEDWSVIGDLETVRDVMDGLVDVAQRMDDDDDVGR